MRPPGLLWDHSLLWGVMALKSLQKTGLPFELVRARDLKEGALEDRPLLFVPGGWASNKLMSLGEGGEKAIKDFVREGGNYLGICGGAGLATKEGIGLIELSRKPTEERLPSFSGRIRLKILPHPVWEGIKAPYSFYLWYPSQFMAEKGIIARFLEHEPSSFTSDICIGDCEAQDEITWAYLEGDYGINLDPNLLYMEPAMVEESYGKGKVILSLVHWDTPFDPKGLRVLRNLWRYLGAYEKRGSASPKRTPMRNPEILESLRLVQGLIHFGIRNFLWYWRNPFLLSWRRGIRGLEYSTLFVLLRELLNSLLDVHIEIYGRQKLEGLKYLVEEFVSKSKRLLFLERFLMNKIPLNWEPTPDPVINALREELFGTMRRHGGLFKEIAEALEELLYLSYLSSS